MKKSSLLYKIINGIWDMCFIWKTEMRSVFRDEGVLIFCILVPLGIRCSTRGFTTTRW